MSTDNYENLMKGWTPYRFGIDNPIRFSDNGGEFEIDEATKKAYPKLDAYLKNIAVEYMNKPTEFKKIFSAYSQLSDEEIIKMLTYDDGPKLIVESLENPDEYGNTPWQFKRDANGKIIKDRLNQPLITDKGYIVVAKDIIDDFEAKQSITNCITAASKKLVIEVTLFHELVHFGDYQNGYIDEKRNVNGKSIQASKLGKSFEDAAYGEVIEVSNAKSYVEKTNYNDAITKQNEFIKAQMEAAQKAVQEMIKNPNNFKYYSPDRTKVNSKNKRTWTKF